MSQIIKSTFKSMDDGRRSLALEMLNEIEANPLFRAISEAKPDRVASLLLSGDADPNQPVGPLSTAPLHWCASCALWCIIRGLESGEDTGEELARVQECVKVLEASGASFEQPDARGLTPQMAFHQVGEMMEPVLVGELTSIDDALWEAGQ